MNQETHMIKRIAGWITAVLLLAVILAAGVAVGKVLVKDLMLTGATMPPASAGSLPVIVDWSLISNRHEEDHATKCGGRARRADGTALASPACIATAH